MLLKSFINNNIGQWTVITTLSSGEYDATAIRRDCKISIAVFSYNINNIGPQIGQKVRALLKCM